VLSFLLLALAIASYFLLKTARMKQSAAGKADGRTNGCGGAEETD
jgi:hypothetical protein